MKVTIDDFELIEKQPPHNDSFWGKVICRTRNNVTGEIRDYHTDDYLGPKKDYFAWNDFWWTEGNASCDCNRALFFGYANGEEYDEIECECGEGRFSIQLIAAKSGKILIDEFKETSQ